MSRHEGSLDCKVYVGGLPKNASKEEIERAFSDFGKLTNVFVARNPPGFAFIEFDDPRDASDAVRAYDYLKTITFYSFKSLEAFLVIVFTNK